MPSKKKAIFFDGTLLSRKYKLTDITVSFLDDIIARSGKSTKDQSATIIRCIESFYEFFKEHANALSGRDPSKSPSDPTNIPDQFSSIGCINLVIRRNTTGVDVYVKMPHTVIKKVDEMVEFVSDKYDFKSSSSIVNHAIAFVFEDQDNALEEYLISSGLRPLT